MDPDLSARDMLAFHLLGAPEIRRHDGSNPGLTSVKAQALLYYLAMTGRTHTRSALAGLLWGDQAESAAQDNLRKALQHLRTSLDAYLTIDRHTVGFQTEQRVWVDALAFASQVEAALSAATLESLQQVMALYRGDFLEGFYVREAPEFEAWMLGERARLREVMVQGVTTLAERYAHQGNVLQAITSVRRLLALEPWREETHRQLMTLLARSGQRATALAHFETCRRVLAEELAVEPEAETLALVAAIRAGDFDQVTPKQSLGWRQGDQVREVPAHLVTSLGNPPSLLVTPLLPVPPTPLLGRQRELAELSELIRDRQCKLIAITGPGGMGKTRLALAAAADQRGHFRQGVVFVPLAGISSAQFLPQAILTALNIPLLRELSPQQQVRTVLYRQEHLLVLDNYEHLLPDVELLIDLLHYAPQTTLLVTSRERLALQAEHVRELTGLDYPPQPSTALQANAPPDLSSYAAVQLFLQRVRQTQPHFTPSDVELAAIVRICRLSEGLPLALELAAALVREQAIATLAAALAAGQASLSSRLRDLPARHRTMVAVFDQSWQLLARDEQCVLQAIAVFRGGFQRAAAELVASATLPLLSALVDKSLLRYSADRRYEVHELIRQYAYEKLAATGKLSGLQERHCRYFLTMVETAEPELTGAQNPAWLEQLDTEHDNLRAALAWSLQAEDTEVAMRLAGALYWYWHLRDDAREGYDWSVAALRRSGAAQRTEAKAKALKGAGTLAWNLGDLATAHALLDESITIWREVGDQGGLAHALLALGWVLREQGNLAASYASHTEGVALFREIGDQWALAFALGSQGTRMMELGDYVTAKGIIEESIALHRTLGTKWGLALVLRSSASLARAQADYATAHGLYQEALTLQREVGHHWHIAKTLVYIAAMKTLLGQPTQAVRLFGTVEAVVNSLGTHMWRDERADFDSSVAAARSQLDATAFAVAWAEGQRMTLEQAVDYARR